MNTTKICSTCNIEKPAAEFYADVRQRSGLRGRCKPCYRLAIAKKAKKPKKPNRPLSEFTPLQLKVLTMLRQNGLKTRELLERLGCHRAKIPRELLERGFLTCDGDGYYELTAQGRALPQPALWQAAACAGRG